jgi:hypothetical protein
VYVCSMSCMYVVYMYDTHTQVVVGTHRYYTLHVVHVVHTCSSHGTTCAELHTFLANIKNCGLCLNRTTGTLCERVQR